MLQAPASSDRRFFSALLFLAAVNEAMQVFGTFCSSPQTTELFAKAREATLMRYVMIANVNAIGLGLFASWIGRSVWPLIGNLFVIAELTYIYKWAARKGKQGPGPISDPTVGLGGQRLR